MVAVLAAVVVPAPAVAAFAAVRHKVVIPGAVARLHARLRHAVAVRSIALPPRPVRLSSAPRNGPVATNPAIDLASRVVGGRVLYPVAVVREFNPVAVGRVFNPAVAASRVVIARAPYPGAVVRGSNPVVVDRVRFLAVVASRVVIAPARCPGADPASGGVVTARAPYPVVALPEATALAVALVMATGHRLCPANGRVEALPNGPPAGSSPAWPAAWPGE